MSKLKTLLFLTACTVLWLITLLHALHSQELIVDEYFHATQIAVFMQGKAAFHPLLTEIPGYHLVVAALMKVLSLDSLQGMRAINTTFGLISAFIFYLIRRTLNEPYALLYAACFLFFPISYPYYFLVYTDTLSLALVLGAFFAALKERHILAALILTAALLVRQNNVVWAAFLPILFAHALQNRFPARSDMLVIVKKNVWPYAIPIAIFLAYWIWHGSISFSKALAAKHPDLSLHPGNLYLFLFLFLLLFPYDAAQGARKFIAYARSKPAILIIPLFLLLFTHLQGSPDNYISPHYYLRNALIQIVAQPPEKWAFSAAIAVAFCAIAYTQFVLSRAWLLYISCAFYICSSWLIEDRYLIIPFALWMALRKIESATVLWWTLLVWIALSLFFTWSVLDVRFML